jgi:hypothetical protein
VGQLSALEVHVFDPQHQCFEKPQSRATEQLHDELGARLDLCHNLTHFVDRQHHRQPLRALRPNDVVDPWR